MLAFHSFSLNVLVMAVIRQNHIVKFDVNHTVGLLKQFLSLVPFWWPGRKADSRGESTRRDDPSETIASRSLSGSVM